MLARVVTDGGMAPKEGLCLWGASAVLYHAAAAQERGWAAVLAEGQEAQEAEEGNLLTAIGEGDEHQHL